ncbi:MAG: hypothetical protein JNK72_14065 [Myxococcales bacterium]|nr:hypothetical protein [Myxococcales bacterium]
MIARSTGLWASAVCAALSGCLDEGAPLFTEAGAQDAGVDAAAQPFDGGLSADVPPVVRPDAGALNTDNVKVYAHTANTLYVVDPRRLSVTRVNDFQFSEDGRDHRMTDIAVNSADELWGITFNAIYRINPNTARCFYAANFNGGDFNGLSFVPGTEFDGTREVLIATSRSGGVFRIDTTNGQATQLGDYGANLGSSGDVVSIESGGTFATVLDDDGIEQLARINALTGRATLIGPTGQGDIWGIGYWRQRLFGFTRSGNFVTLDLNNGHATVLSRSNESWWGAGVTTLAPTAPP